MRAHESEGLFRALAKELMRTKKFDTRGNMKSENKSMRLEKQIKMCVIVAFERILVSCGISDM